MPKQKENLNAMGEWINTFSRILNVYWEDISRRAHIDRSTIPQLAHGPMRHPMLRTIREIWRGVQSIAEEKGVPFSVTVETAFFNAMGHATQIQVETSRMVLNALRAQHGLGALDVEMDHLAEMSHEVARQEISDLRYELRRKEERIAELEQELQKWRS